MGLIVGEHSQAEFFFSLTVNPFKIVHVVAHVVSVLPPPPPSNCYIPVNVRALPK